MQTGTYLMKLPKYDESFILHRIRVKIIGESEKSYHVELLERGPSGQRIGTKYWPRKRNVVNLSNNEVTREVVDIRLPYKD